MTTGYSGTPLAKKLGIKFGFQILLINEPEHYFDLFTDLPKIDIIRYPDDQSIDFIHIFSTDLKNLEKDVLTYKPYLKKDGMLWISWPKGTSTIPTNLKREPVRELLLQLGLVDTKVAAIDEDWSGLKFVYRIKDR